MATTKNEQRVNFSRMQKHMPYPDFLEIQLKSFADFVQMDSTPEQRRKEGLFKVFSENTLNNPSLRRCSGVESICRNSWKDFS